MLVLGLAVIIYYVVVVVETMKGYPGLERFFLPDASLICVLGGYGIVRIAQLAGELRPADPAPPVPRSRPSAAACWWCWPAHRAVHHDADLRGPRRVPAGVAGGDDLQPDDEGGRGRRRARWRYPCKTSFSAVNHGVQSEMAWKLKVPLERVGTRMTQPGVDFIGPHNSVTGSPAPVDPRLTHHQVLAASPAGWSCARRRPGLPQACDGH